MTRGSPFLCIVTLHFGLFYCTDQLYFCMEAVKILKANQKYKFSVKNLCNGNHNNAISKLSHHVAGFD